MDFEKSLVRFLIITLVLFPIVFSMHAVSQNILVPDTIRSCRVDSLLLDAGSGYDTYQWSTGATTQTAWFKETGNYFVHVTQGDTIDIIEDFIVIIIDSQVHPVDTLVYCGDTVILSGDNSYYDFLWMPGALTGNEVIVFPKDTTYYIVLITDPTDPVYYCIDTVLVSVEPLIIIDTVIQTSIGCPGEDKAKIKLQVSGGYPPYIFHWPTEAIPLFEDPSFAIGLTDGTKTIQITDSVGCIIQQDFEVKAHPIPELVLDSDPLDIVYLQKPFVNFSFTNPMYDSIGTDTFLVSWWQWNFGDDIQSILSAPTHTYQQTGIYNVVLNFRTFYECEGSDSLTIEVKPVKLKLPSVITPNGDSFNDFFEIWEDIADGSGNSSIPDLKSSSNGTLINLDEYYMSNNLIIFNRWGEKVYEVSNYQNDWDAEGLLDGVYFYLLQCVGYYQNDVYRGSFQILTGQTF